MLLVFRPERSHVPDPASVWATQVDRRADMSIDRLRVLCSLNNVMRAESGGDRCSSRPGAPERASGDPRYRTLETFRLRPGHGPVSVAAMSLPQSE